MGLWRCPCARPSFSQVRGTLRVEGPLHVHFTHGGVIRRLALSGPLGCRGTSPRLQEPASAQEAPLPTPHHTNNNFAPLRPGPRRGAGLPPPAPPTGQTAGHPGQPVVRGGSGWLPSSARMDTAFCAHRTAATRTQCPSLWERLHCCGLGTGALERESGFR